MIEGKGPIDKPQSEKPDDTRPQGPVAHKEIDIGEEPQSTTDSNDQTTQGGGSTCP